MQCNRKYTKPPTQKSYSKKKKKKSDPNLKPLDLNPSLQEILEIKEHDK